MVEFKDLPKTILKRFVIVEQTDNYGNRLFIIKKRIPLKERVNYYKKFTTKGIPHKYQQNNTLEEAQKSIREYIINEIGITPSMKYYRRPSKFKIFLKLFLRFFGVRL